jgi:hypothetical protein
MSSTKIIQLEETSVHGEPTVQLINFNNVSRIKTASEATDYIKEIKPKKGKTYVLVLAVSASEAYGPNRNGDAFSEKPIKGLIGEGETLLDSHESFENAGIYQHHVNKDKAKSMGKVMKSFYNPKMRRVELLLELDNTKAKKVVEKIASGSFPAVSMGCKIKYDVCSRTGCHNKARTQADYCDHAKYAMNEIDPKTGEKNFVYNPSPKFFDISFVMRPADRVGYMMRKVADTSSIRTSSFELGQIIDDRNEKISEANKLSKMNKVLVGKVEASNPSPEDLAKNFTEETLPKSVENSCALPDSLIDRLSQHSLPVGLSTLGAAGITPTTVEVTRIIFRRAGLPKPPEKVEQRIVGVQDKLFSLLSMFPGILSGMQGSGIVKLSSDLIDYDLLRDISPLMEKRSNIKDYIYRRVVGDQEPEESDPPSRVKDYVYRRAIGDVSPEKGYHDLVTFQDEKGGVYQTTRKAVEVAQDSALERDAKALAGAGALGGTAYKVLTSGRLGKILSPLILAGSAVGGKAVYDTAKIPDHPGTSIPVHTEVRKIGRAKTAYDDSSIYSMLAQEYYHPNHRMYDYMRTCTHNAKTAAMNSGTMAFLQAIDKPMHEDAVRSIMEPFTKHSSDKIGEDIHLEDLFFWVGEGLYS